MKYFNLPDVRTILSARAPLRTIMEVIFAGAMLIALPLLGLAAKGVDLAPYLEFPPLTRYVRHAPFDTLAFAMISAVNLTLVAGIALLLKRACLRPRDPRALRRHVFPRWGWSGLLLLAAGWTLAWTRLPWFTPLQHQNYCLPWLGYILTVNAWCVQRSGRSLMTDTPRMFALLFPASACFWWFFEYLNRFVQNWFYVNVADFGPLGYALSASLAFSTVLPAVLSTHRLLLTLAIFNPGLLTAIRIPWAGNRWTAAVLLAAAGAGLALIGVYPDHLFPVVWFAPLMIITALQQLGGRTTIFSNLRTGDWRAIVAAATAALLCGFLWEMWNFFSLTRWQYTIPFVDRYHLFAMPLLGYGGYLPFGLECLAVGQILMRRNEKE